MITTPTENPNIPENLVQQIEMTRNQISLNESEITRLRGLVNSLKQEINQLVVDKQALVDEIPTLQARVLDLSGEQSRLLTELESVRIEKADLESLIQQQTKELNIKLEEFESKQAEVAIGQAQLATDKSRLVDEQQRLAKESVDFKIKVGKLTQVLNEL